MLNEDGVPEEDLQGPSTGPQDTGAMFAALLEQMKKMNENILSMNEPVDLGDDETSSNDGQSFDGRVANLTASSTKEPNILADIARDLDASEKTGPAASEDLAGIVNALLKEKLPEEKIQLKVDMYPRPQNVTGLRTPRVNPLIWNQISATSRTNDSKTQKSQNALVAGVGAMIKATDTILKSELKDNKELIQFMTDAIALTIQYQHDLNAARRRAMKNDLNKDYAALCNSPPDDPTSEFLFGDLSKLAKDISDANRLTKKVRPSSSTQSSYKRDKRYVKKNYGNNRYVPYRGRNDFLSKGSSPRNRKKEGSYNNNNNKQ